MKKNQFVTLVAAVSLSVVLGMVVAAALGFAGPGLRAEEGSRPQAPLMLRESPLDAPTLALPSFADLVERANPAIVGITNVRFSDGSERNPHSELRDDPFFRWFFGPGEPEGQQDENQPRRRSESGGSGFVISENGYILTNHHVVENAERIVVAFDDGREFEAHHMGSDPAIDLALIKVEADGLVSLPLGDSEELRVGEWVVAIGNPLNFDHTVTAGVVSAKERRLGGLSGLDQSLSSFIQTDAAINFGNSGGPLLNTRGEVVGINTAITRGNGFNQGVIQGIGFALPINKAKGVLEQLRETGRVSRGYLGVSIDDLDAEKREYLSQAYGLDDIRGAFVQTVEPGTPAREAGLKPEDVIVEIDGTPVESTNDLISRVSSLPPGETVKLGILRDGERESLRVTLGDRAQLTGQPAVVETPQPNEGEVVSMGFTVEPLSREVREQIGIDDLEGVLVTEVDQDGPAFERGLRRNNVILEVDGRRVRDLDEYRDAVREVRSGRILSLRIGIPVRRGEMAERTVFFRIP